MKLYEAIRDLPDKQWLDISEIKRDKSIHIGRIPKELLRGEILGREVIKYLSDVREENIHHVYVEIKKEIHKFE